MSEWSDWIEHDGKGCPCKGEYAQFYYKDLLQPQNPRRPDKICEGIAYGDLSEKSGWLWENAPRVLVIIRYRIRKPRGLTILENLIADLPVKVDA